MGRCTVYIGNAAATFIVAVGQLWSLLLTTLFKFQIALWQGFSELFLFAILMNRKIKELSQNAHAFFVYLMRWSFLKMNGSLE